MMGTLKVLDCTLRDGGYCNNWCFGLSNIRKILSNLVNAGVDIIECGFLSNCVDNDANYTRFPSINNVKNILPKIKHRQMFVCMINYGEYGIDDLSESDCIDGIRVAFHKKDMIEALEFCKKIKDKGYKVFVQAMVSLNYTDEEYLNLLKRVNEIEPYAFYIVDSFGVMKKIDMSRLFYMVDHNLKDKIALGYHSHNNMQLSYANAQYFADIHTKRDLIVDTSIYGMGRGAGNLNTELFLEYLNDNYGKTYLLKPILNTIDEALQHFYVRNFWGYSLPNYLSAKHNAHPNYAGYLYNKQTLTYEDMDEIFMQMDDNKKVRFDKIYIEELYLNYMKNDNLQETRLHELKAQITGKEVLIIAPGRSAVEEQTKVLDCMKYNEVISISVNGPYKICDTDYIFLSNLRRYREMDLKYLNRCIVTSNIPKVDAYLQVSYQELLNDDEVVFDNAGLMLIQFLINLKVKKILLAGMDGFSTDVTQNFADEYKEIYTKRDELIAMNEGMERVLSKLKNKVAIEFITSPHYVRVA